MTTALLNDTPSPIEPKASGPLTINREVTTEAL
jgi:hypothetical protein